MDHDSSYDRPPCYNGYKMKYGYIWTCRYYNHLNHGILIPFQYSCYTIERRKRLLKWCVFSLPIYQELEWNIQRLLWIAHYKYDSKCNLSQLPKDIIKEIIGLSKIHIHEKLIKCPKIMKNTYNIIWK